MTRQRFASIMQPDSEEDSFVYFDSYEHFVVTRGVPVNYTSGRYFWREGSIGLLGISVINGPQQPLLTEEIQCFCTCGTGAECSKQINNLILFIYAAATNIHVCK